MNQIFLVKPVTLSESKRLREERRKRAEKHVHLLPYKLTDYNFFYTVSEDTAVKMAKVSFEFHEYKLCSSLLGIAFEFTFVKQN